MHVLAAVDLVSALVGFIFGLVLMLVGKVVDHRRSDAQRDMQQATVLGELRAGFSGLSGRVGMVEQRLAQLGARMDAHTESLHARLYTGEQ